MSEIFSTSLGGDAFSRVGLDERQDIANRGYKGAAKTIKKAFVAKLAAIVGVRERVMGRIEEDLFPGVNKADSVTEFVEKRQPTVAQAMKVVPDSLAVLVDGRRNLAALDGRVLTEEEGEEILAVPRRCEETWANVITNSVLNDNTVKGAVKTRLKSTPPPARTSNKSTKQKGRSSALKKSVSSLNAQAVEQHRIFNSLLGRGNLITTEELFRVVIHIWAVVLQAMAIEERGESPTRIVADPFISETH